MWINQLPAWAKTIFILTIIILISGVIGYQLDLSFYSTPTLENTLTPLTKSTPQVLGSYDALGKVITPTEAAQLLQTEGCEKLSADQGVVAITPDLINLGRQEFYEQTFGNELFITDVVGALNGPINLVSLSKAIAKLGGKPTTNLQITLDQDVTIGGKQFPAGTKLNTGLDVPPRSLIPLGMKTRIKNGSVKVGITCAACHATLDLDSEKVLEGAPNLDINPGLILAFASNSAAMFRQTDINPTEYPTGDHNYLTADNKTAQLPHTKILEDAVDAAFLSWVPGSFDSTGTLVNNPSQIPPSYTFENYPYGWSGHSAIGWFHGLITLNSNVHATNADATTTADSSLPVLGIDKETYLGILLQNAANSAFRLPQGVKPSEFFDQIDPTPGEPAMNEVIRMPGYPKGSPFMLDGLMANSPGFKVGEQLNAMSAWQNTLAPPPYSKTQDLNTLKQGAKIFTKAGCAECHSGRYFTNHHVIPQQQIKTQPSRANTLALMAKAFIEPKTYPNSLTVPLGDNPPVLSIPKDITPAKDQQLAFALNNPAGGYKVPGLIGLAVTPPYLHDGGVAATPEALQMNAENTAYQVVNPDQMGMAGTLIQNRLPDAAASLRVLLDRNLRQVAIAQNQANLQLQRANIEGVGHEYWVDRQSNFTVDEQTALIEFLLSLDDDPVVLASEKKSV